MVQATAWPSRDRPSLGTRCEPSQLQCSRFAATLLLLHSLHLFAAVRPEHNACWRKPLSVHVCPKTSGTPCANAHWSSPIVALGDCVCGQGPSSAPQTAKNLIGASLGLANTAPISAGRRSKQ